MERLFGFGLVTGAIAYSLYRWYYTDHRLEFHATVVTNVDNQPIGLSEILNAVEDVLGRQSSVANDTIDDVDMEDISIDDVDNEDVSIDDVDMEDVSIDDVDMEDVHDAEGLYLEDEGNDEYNMDYDEENFCPVVYYNADESQTRVLLSHPQQNPRKSKVRKKEKHSRLFLSKDSDFTKTMMTLSTMWMITSKMILIWRQWAEAVLSW